jgi:hypothetical protein
MRQVLPYIVEFFTFCGLSLLWLITAIVASVYVNNQGWGYLFAYSIAVSAAFAWINLLLHIGSAVIAFLQSRDDPKLNNVQTPHTAPTVDSPSSATSPSYAAATPMAAA